MVASITTKALVVYGGITLASVCMAIVLAVSKGNDKDPLNKCIAFKDGFFGEPCMSWWPVTHFLLYLVIGLVFPADWMVWWFTGGMWWEALEAVYGAIHIPSERDNCTDCQYTVWLGASVMDIVMNGAGLTLGWFLRKYVFRY